jgi:hypothetical protein
MKGNKKFKKSELDQTENIYEKNNNLEEENKENQDENNIFDELSDESGDEVGFIIKSNNEEKKTQILFTNNMVNNNQSELNKRNEDRTAFQGDNYADLTYAGPKIDISVYTTEIDLLEGISLNKV